MDKEVKTRGAWIPSKQQASRSKAPPTIITTRVNMFILPIIIIIIIF